MSDIGKQSRIFPMAVIIAAAVTMIFRTAQLLVAVDYNTMGFFDKAMPFFATEGIYVFMILSALVFAICMILDAKNRTDAFTCSAENISPKYTLVMGIMFGVGLCLRVIELILHFEGLNLNLIGEVINLAAFMGAAYMLIAHKGLKPSVGYFQLIISISYTVKSASLFMSDTVIVKVSDELILLLSYVSAVLFFLSFGRFASGNKAKGTMPKMVFFGGTTAVLSAAASLSGIIAYFVDKVYMQSHMSVHPISEIGTAVIALGVIFALYGKKQEKNEFEEIQNTAETAQP